MLLGSRQCGKSFIASALALRTALAQPDSLVLILSPTLRQSGLFFRKSFLRFWKDLGYPLKGERPNRLEVEFSNGSHVVALPDSEEGIRGFSGVKLLVIDEASRVSDELYDAVTPMLATSGGKLVALSTPWAKQGWFFKAWTNEKRDWKQVEITAAMCPRISKKFLEKERRKKGDRVYRMEYECKFGELSAGYFNPEDIAAALEPDGEIIRLG